MLKCIVGNTEINCFDGKYDKYKLKKWSNENRLICPDCGKAYEYCHGEVVSPYFRHKEKSLECDSIYSEPETQEHIQGKTDLYNWLLSIKNEYNIENLHLEYYIKETRQKPDIYFEQYGIRYAIEYQCTPISSEYIKRRELYKLAGITDIWILGCSKYTGTKHIEKSCHIYYNSLKKYMKIKDTNIKNCGVDTIGTDKFLLECFCIDDKRIKFTKKYTDCIYDRFKNKINLDENNEWIRRNRQNVFSELENRILSGINLKTKTVELYYNYLINDYGCIDIHFKLLNSKNTMRLISLNYDEVTIYEKHSDTRFKQIWSMKKRRYVNSNQREYFYSYDNEESYQIKDFNYDNIAKIVLDGLKDVLDRYK